MSLTSTAIVVPFLMDTVIIDRGRMRRFHSGYRAVIPVQRGCHTRVFMLANNRHRVLGSAKKLLKSGGWNRLATEPAMADVAGRHF
jgi:hypothetical protein